LSARFFSLLFRHEGDPVGGGDEPVPHFFWSQDFVRRGSFRRSFVLRSLEKWPNLVLNNHKLVCWFPGSEGFVGSWGSGSFIFFWGYFRSFFPLEEHAFEGDFRFTRCGPTNFFTFFFPFFPEPSQFSSFNERHATAGDPFFSTYSWPAKHPSQVCVRDVKFHGCRRPFVFCLR